VTPGRVTIGYEGGLIDQVVARIASIFADHPTVLCAHCRRPVYDEMSAGSRMREHRLASDGRALPDSGGSFYACTGRCCDAGACGAILLSLE
jgi:hypothetical protein